MKLRKIIGWLLLIAGILIIFWTLYSSYNIFTAKREIPEIFKIAEKETSLLPEIGPQDLQTQIEKMIGKQLKEILPLDFLPTLFNLISWSIFAGIATFGGAQISNLGIKLIKN